MSGGSNPVKKALGKGDAWKEKGWGGQQAVVNHAKKLGYPGKIAKAGSSKAEWTAFTKKFNAWKASGMKGKKTAPKKAAPKKAAPKPAPAPAPEPVIDITPEAGSAPGLGPYPERNVFFPMLNQEYTAPSAMDLSAYLPADAYGDGMLTRGAPARYDQAVFPGVYDDAGKLDMTKDVGRPDYTDMRGLLYQPFTTEYQQAFVAPSLWNYQPPQLKVGPVQFMGNPYAMSPAALAASSGGGGGGGKKKKPKPKPTIEEGGRDGGKGPGDIGYGASNPAYGYVDFGHLVDDMSNIAIGYDNLANMYGYDDAGTGSDTSAGKGSFGGMSAGLAGPR